MKENAMVPAFKNIKTKSILTNVGVTFLIAWWIETWFLIDFFLAWAFAVNIVTFTLFGKDKMAAQLGRTRTPETILLTMGALGGFPALFAGFNIFNHKTKKASFFVPMWILFIIQIVLGAWFYGNLDEVYYNWLKKPQKAQQQLVQSPPLQNTQKPLQQR